MMNPQPQPPMAAAAQMPQQGASPDQYRQWLESLPPDQRQEALQRLLRNYGMEEDATAQQYRYAQRIKDQPGVTRTGGRFGTTVAANPLEHAATAAKNAGQYKKQKKLEGKMEELQKAAAQAGMDVANAKFAGPGNQPQPPAKQNPLAWIFGNI